MKKIFFLFVSAILLNAGVTVKVFKDFGSATIRIAGGTAHIPIMKSVSKEIKQVNPKIKIAIAGGGSGVGIKKVGEGLVDIGNAGRKPTPKEIKKYNLKLFKWAIDGIAVVVNKKNNLVGLTKEDIQKIFSGKIKNWKDVGGMDAKINIYTRDKASGTRKVFWKKILNKGEISKKALFMKSNGSMKRAVKNDVNGIGFMSAGFIDSTIKGVEIDGVAPSAKNIKMGKYKFTRGLYSLTKGQPKGLVKSFIEYLFSKHVQEDIVAKKGFIPVK